VRIVRRSVRRALVVACAAVASTLAAGGCNALTGASDLEVGEAAEGGAGDEGGLGAPFGRDDAGLPDVTIVEAGDGQACACVGAAPTGWVGPVALWEGAGAPPECAGELGVDVLDAHASPDAPPASCACDCGPVTGGSCPTSVTVNVFNSSACLGGACNTATLSADDCTTIDKGCLILITGGLSADLKPSGAACAPKAASDVAPPAWGVSARACQAKTPPERGSCGEGELCAALPSAPMLPRPCVVAQGDVACPKESGYAVKHLYFAGSDDTRACTPCTCDASDAGTCKAELNVGCGGAGGGTVTLPTKCSPLGSDRVELMAAPAFVAGSCVKKGGAPTGELTPTQPTTVCCVP
jgi:hypothetical protein